MPNRFDGQTAIITGGASGLGLGIASRLAEEGARVSLWDKDKTALAAAQSKIKDSHGVAVDIVDPAAVEAAVAATVNAVGRPDILIASAGISGMNARLWEYPLDEWNRVIQINLTGLFHCARSVVPRMLEANYGRIVNIASIAGKEGNPNAAAYSASKAGVIALTKSLGKETAANNIAVNCITPAAARTRMFEQMSKEHVDYMLSKIPRGRFLEVNEVSAMVALLV